MNPFSGIRSVFDAANAVCRFLGIGPDGPPFATVSRALVDKNGAVIFGGDTTPIPFYATATLTSAAGATAVSLLPDSSVPSNRKVVVTGFVGKVNGATNWATTAHVYIQDTAASPVKFFDMAVAALTGNAEVRPGTSNVSSQAAYTTSPGGTAGKGLNLVADANGTGSNLVVAVHGYLIPA